MLHLMMMLQKQDLEIVEITETIEITGTMVEAKEERRRKRRDRTRTANLARLWMLFDFATVSKTPPNSPPRHAASVKSAGALTI